MDEVNKRAVRRCWNRINNYQSKKGSKVHVYGLKKARKELSHLGIKVRGLVTDQLRIHRKDLEGSYDNKSRAGPGKYKIKR